MFVIESGGSLSNVVIGPNQIEGVHCNGGCKLSNVEWTAVCKFGLPLPSVIISLFPLRHQVVLQLMTDITQARMPSR